MRDNFSRYWYVNICQFHHPIPTSSPDGDRSDKPGDDRPFLYLELFGTLFVRFPQDRLTVIVLANQYLDQLYFGGLIFNELFGKN